MDRVDRWVDSMRRAGAHAATTDWDLGDRVIVRNLRWVLSKTHADASLAAVHALAALSDAPIRVNELERESTNASTFMRIRAGSEPASFAQPALDVLAVDDGSQWILERVTVFPSVVFATEANVVQLRACAEHAPRPEDQVRAQTFKGVSFPTGCEGGMSSYEYLPKVNDHVTWIGSPKWIQWGKLWGMEQTVELTIHPSSHWPNIAASDCYCHGVAGFTVLANPLDGRIRHYVPGIGGCVVC